MSPRNSRVAGQLPSQDPGRCWCRATSAPGCPMLARTEDVADLLVDPDVYEEKHLYCQDIYTCDVGRPKAWSKRAGLRRINPAVDARALCSRVEDLPWACCRSTRS